MFVRLIVLGAIDWTELALAGDAALQMLADFFIAGEPICHTSGSAERSGDEDEQRQALHLLILGSELCNASVVAALAAASAGTK
jgi:hypothetical protein